MILYLDTSAPVKLYVDEDDAVVIRDAVKKAELAGTCEVAYVEMRSAIASAIVKAHSNRPLIDEFCETSTPIRSSYF